MNKSIFLLLLVVMLFTDLKAQLVEGSDPFRDSFVLITKTADLSKIEGSPYFDKEFRAGTLHVEGKEPLSVFLRYDVVNERMEIKPRKNISETYMLSRNENTMYEIGKDKYLVDKINSQEKVVYGYFVELYNGDNYRLLKKPTASLTEPVRAKTGYEKDKPARIEIKESYYVVSDSEMAQEVELKNRKIKKVFSSSETKNYLKDHKIKTEEDLVEFISFLDQQE